MDATERLLREQAIAHGLDNYAPEPVDPLTPADIEAAIRGDAEADEAELHSIAGLRGGHVAARDEGGGSFTIGARWRAAVVVAEKNFNTVLMLMYCTVYVLNYCTGRASRARLWRPKESQNTCQRV